MAEYTKIKTARTIICELCNELYPDDPCEPADCDWLRMLEEDALSCDNCKWLGKRHQKCSCCRRNNGMKDNAVAMTVSVLRDDGTCFNLGIKCFGTSELQSGKILRFTDDKGGDIDA